MPRLPIHTRVMATSDGLVRNSNSSSLLRLIKLTQLKTGARTAKESHLRSNQLLAAEALEAKEAVGSVPTQAGDTN